MGFSSPLQDGFWHHTAAHCCLFLCCSQAAALFLFSLLWVSCSSTHHRASLLWTPSPVTSDPLCTRQAFKRQLGPAQTLLLRLDTLRGAVEAFSLILLLLPGKSVTGPACLQEAALSTERCSPCYISLLAHLPKLGAIQGGQNQTVLGLGSLWEETLTESWALSCNC